MKHDVLRAAAHNIADSFANGVSLLTGWYDNAFVWDDVAASANKELHFDLLSSEGGQPGYSLGTQRFLEAMRKIVPDQLAREGCDPQQVAQFEITLRRSTVEPISGREVLVMVTDTRGKSSIDRYVGMPLTRIQRLDSLGRRRRVASNDGALPHEEIEPGQG